MRLEIFGPGYPDAVLTGEGAFELPHEIRDLICDPTKLESIMGIMEIEDRPNMQQPGCGMTIVADLNLQRFHYSLQGFHVFRKLFRSDRRIFNAGYRLGAAL